MSFFSFFFFFSPCEGSPTETISSLAQTGTSTVSVHHLQARCPSSVATWELFLYHICNRTKNRLGNIPYPEKSVARSSASPAGEARAARCWPVQVSDSGGRWSYAHMVIRSYGRMVIWSYDIWLIHSRFPLFLTSYLPPTPSLHVSLSLTRPPSLSFSLLPSAPPP